MTEIVESQTIGPAREYTQPTEVVVESIKPVEPLSSTLSEEDQPKISPIRVREINAGQVRTGKLLSSAGGTYFDLDKDLIVMNDGTNNRVLIGDSSKLT